MFRFPQPHTTLKLRGATLRFYLGDSLDILPRFQPGSIDAIVTSPRGRTRVAMIVPPVCLDCRRNQPAVHLTLISSNFIAGGRDLMTQQHSIPHARISRITRP